MTVRMMITITTSAAQGRPKNCWQSSSAGATLLFSHTLCAKLCTCICPYVKLYLSVSKYSVRHISYILYIIYVTLHPAFIWLTSPVEGLESQRKYLLFKLAYQILEFVFEIIATSNFYIPVFLFKCIV